MQSSFGTFCDGSAWKATALAWLEAGTLNEAAGYAKSGISRRLNMPSLLPVIRQI
ncbi:hypothetical protein [Qipengyuania sp. Mu-71]|uniref:hypothetical protein n=1 Tax=Qipengyuania sp. Mu-71 TaxID=3121477 RepID=UPI002FE46868